MDLISVANDLKTVPDQALASELQNPSGVVPAYLVLSELQRRQLLRAGGGNWQKSPTSVLQDTLQQLQAPRPVGPPPPPGMTPPTMAQPRTGLAAMPGTMPPQNMAMRPMQEGGLVSDPADYLAQMSLRSQYAGADLLPGMYQAGGQAKDGDTKAPPSLLEQAATAYPGIADALRSAAFRVSPIPADTSDQRVLEFYPPGEEDSFDRTKPAIEVFGNRAKPEDVAGDLVSHYLSQGADPTVTKAYQNFEASLTPEQKSRLQDQYQWDIKNAGETRPYQDWYKASGFPAYFRGYAFHQWPNPSKFYTPGQIKLFDDLNRYLKTAPQKHPDGGYLEEMMRRQFGGAIQRFADGGEEDDDEGEETPSTGYAARSVAAYDPTPAEETTLNKVVHRESGGNPRARNPHSTASGLHGFINSTWQETAAKTGVGTEYPSAYLAPPRDQQINALHLLREDGPNSSHSWAASGPYPDPYANPLAPRRAPPLGLRLNNPDPGWVQSLEPVSGAPQPASTPIGPDILNQLPSSAQTLSALADVAPALNVASTGPPTPGATPAVPAAGPAPLQEPASLQALRDRYTQLTGGQLSTGQTVPGHTAYDPTAAFNADNIQKAKDAMGIIMGPKPDYSQLQAAIGELQSQAQASMHPTLSNTLLRMGAALLAAPPTGFGQAFGRASLETMQAQEQEYQTARQNYLAALNAGINLQSKMNEYDEKVGTGAIGLIERQMQAGVTGEKSWQQQADKAHEDLIKATDEWNKSPAVQQDRRMQQLNVSRAQLGLPPITNPWAPDISAKDQSYILENKLPAVTKPTLQEQAAEARAQIAARNIGLNPLPGQAMATLQATGHYDLAAQAAENPEITEQREQRIAEGKRKAAETGPDVIASEAAIVHDNPDFLFDDVKPDHRPLVIQEMQARGWPVPVRKANKTLQDQAATSQTALLHVANARNMLADPFIQQKVLGPVEGRLQKGLQTTGADIPGLTPDQTRKAQDFLTSLNYLFFREGRPLFGGRPPEKLMMQLAESSPGVQMAPARFAGALDAVERSANFAIQSERAWHYGSQPPAAAPTNRKPLTDIFKTQ